MMGSALESLVANFPSLLLTLTATIGIFFVGVERGREKTVSEWIAVCETNSGRTLALNRDRL